MKILSVIFALAFLLVAACEPRKSETVTAENSADEVVVAPEESRERAPPRDEDTVAGYHGFGPANFGDNEESVRIAWGMPLTLSGQTGDSCRQLFMDPPLASGFGISFMLEDGRFVRYDVGNKQFTAPGGGVVGDSAEKIAGIYAGRLEKMPHKYVEGAEYLVVNEEKAGPVRLVFETDAQGLVTGWRIGLPPAVFFVEGCG